MTNCSLAPSNYHEVSTPPITTLVPVAPALMQTARKSEPAKWSHIPISALDREALYREFAPLVFRLIRQYGHDPELRQDLTGEIYCRFCTLLDAYDPTRGVPLRPYLVRQLTAAVYTYARHHWRRQKREVVLEEEPIQSHMVIALDPTPGWVHALSQQMVIAELPEALLKLPVRQRQVVIWRYYEERSFEEIAMVLNIQPATARSLLRHGLNNLRKYIGVNNAEGV